MVEQFSPPKVTTDKFFGPGSMTNVIKISVKYQTAHLLGTGRETKLKLKHLQFEFRAFASKEPISHNRNNILDQESIMPQGTRTNKHLSSIAK